MGFVLTSHPVKSNNKYVTEHPIQKKKYEEFFFREPTILYVPGFFSNMELNKVG